MRETVIFATKDNRPIAVNIEYTSPAEKSQKVFQCKSYFDNHNYSEYKTDHDAFVAGTATANADIMQQVDVENSNFLKQEIAGYSYMKLRSDYINNLESNNNYPSSMPPLLPDVDYRFLDSEVPEEIKNLGFQLHPKDDEYEIVLNPSTGLYEIPHFSTYRAWVAVGTRSIQLVRNHFKMAPAIKRKMDSMIADYKRAKRSDSKLTPSLYASRISNAKDRSLFNIYADEYRYAAKRKYFLAHEFKHIKNKMFYDALYLDRGTKRPTVEDLYRLNVEDERSAYLSQVINSVNKYLMNGDLNDFSMFDGESQWLRQQLQALPESQRKSCATNLPNIVQGELDNFERVHRDKYDQDQFKAHLENSVDRAPMSVDEDTARELFFRIRKQFYKFAVYNPDTGRMEQKSLADYIDVAHEVAVRNQTQQDIIAAGKTRLDTRKQEYERKLRGGTINPSLVEPAKKVVRDNMHQPRFIGTDNLNIETLDINVTPHLPQAPNGPTMPRPRHPNADWSIYLQQYWRVQEGYEEIVRSNDEYSFKIHNDQITYTDKNSLSVSMDSAYDTYMKILKEPSNRNTVINFMDTLSKQEALKLYVACVVQGREMKGNIPADLNGLENIQGIPAADIQRARQFMQSHAPATPQNPSRQGTPAANAADNTVKPVRSALGTGTRKGCGR